MKRSESISKLMPALIAARGEISNVKRSATNPHFKSRYAPLDEIVSACEEALNKNGLHVFNDLASGTDGIIVSACVYHVSGEWMELDGIRVKPVKDDPQGVGSAVTYGRRYTLTAILGIATEDDDDGNAASKQPIKSAIQELPKGNKQNALNAIQNASTLMQCASIREKLRLSKWTDEEANDIAAALKQRETEVK